MNRRIVLTRKLPFTRDVTLERVRIYKPGKFGPAAMSHIKRNRIEVCEADFVLEIDYDALVNRFFEGAALSRGGKSQIAGGLVRLVRRNEKILRAQEQEHPLPEGWGEAEITSV